MNLPDDFRKKILIITPRPPYPIISGGEHAQFHFIEEMKSIMDVSICFEINSSDYNSNPDDFLRLKEIWNNVTFFPLLKIENQSVTIKTFRVVKRRITRLKQIVFNLLSNQKSTIDDRIRYQSHINQPFLLYNADFVNHVEGILKKNKFDIIQIEFINLAPLVYILPADCVKVLVHHELRYIRIKREVDLFEKTEAFDICRLESIRDQELALLNRFDKIITLTENDKNVLALNISPDKICVSPATIKRDQHQNGSFSPFKTKLVFIGFSRHLPNKDGLEWFINSVMPLIENNLPDIHLEIVGVWDKSFIKQYSRKNIKFTGYLEDLSAAFRSSLLIVPIRMGSGMRVKIVEAISFGNPFITTSIGVEGLTFENNIDCIIADSPVEFAKGIQYLSENPLIQADLTKHALGKLNKEYSYEGAIKRRLDFYNSLT